MDNMCDLINSLYLGDRFCEGIEFLDGKIIVQINCISRIKKSTTSWNYYTDEDIYHGRIVFDGVDWFKKSNEIDINDEIEIKVEDKTDDEEYYIFCIYGCNVSADDATSTDVEIKIKAKRAYILDKDNIIVTGD